MPMFYVLMQEHFYAYGIKPSLVKMIDILHGMTDCTQWFELCIIMSNHLLSRMLACNKENHQQNNFAYYLFYSKIPIVKYVFIIQQIFLCTICKLSL